MSEPALVIVRQFIRYRFVDRATLERFSESR